MSADLGGYVLMAAFSAPMWLPGGMVGTIVALSFDRSRSTVGVASGFLIGGALEFITVMPGGLISLYKEKVLKIPRR